MRIIFFGTSAFAVPSLERVVAHGHEVVVCVTQPDRPQGRGLAPAPSPVKRAATQLGLPLAQPERPQRVLLEPLKPEVGVVVAYGQLIRRELLALPRLGMVGVHPSLLPKYRGAAPIAWAILKGEPQTGVTVFRLNESLDAGELMLQQTVAIEPGETAESLSERLSRFGADALVRALELMAAGRARFSPQNDAQASVAPKLAKAQGRIDWSQSADAIERLIRATVPWPGATTEWRGRPLKIWAAAVGQTQPPPTMPGTVIGASGERLEVAAGRGVLELLELQPAGGRRMRVREFLAGHRIATGDTLG